MDPTLRRDAARSRIGLSALLGLVGVVFLARRSPSSGGPPAARPLWHCAWQRLSVRTVGLLVGVTLLAIGVVGTLIYEHSRRDLQATLGTLLLNIARTGAPLVDPALHAGVQRTLSQDSDAYLDVRTAEWFALATWAWGWKLAAFLVTWTLLGFIVGWAMRKAASSGGPNR